MQFSMKKKGSVNSRSWEDAPLLQEENPEKDESDYDEEEGVEIRYEGEEPKRYLFSTWI